MKYFISHRGNLNGPSPKEENSPDYIENALREGYDVEVDVWLINKSFYLGHDKPQYLIDENFLKNNKLWCHAKNIEALKHMIDKDIHCFWHQDDDLALTSKNFLWFYPGKAKEKVGIEVMPELVYDSIEMFKINTSGVCSDYIKIIKKNN